MTPPSARRQGAAVLAAVALAACSSAPRTGAQTSPPPLSADQAAYERTRADSARYAYTPADIQFMSGMISHHAQAIVMARMAPTREASPSVRTLAERIITAQQDEIGLMQQWLRDRRLPVPEARPGPMKMVVNGVEHEMMMPGMLTDEQLAQLGEARGRDFDHLFLTFMIQHHNGAVSMVKELFATDGAGQDDTVFKFASDVNVDQTTEIARMERMLFLIRLEQRSP